jgi:tetratricopeptide (TPR) repeat protein
MKEKVACPLFCFLVIVLCVSLMTGISAGQNREINATGEYIMGDGETMAVSEERARINAIRQAAEEAGALVKSYSKVRNLALQDDEVEIIANHAMKITVLSKSRAMAGDAVRITVKIKAVIAEADIEANLKQGTDERQTIAEHRKLKEEFIRQGRELEILKKQLATAPVEKRKEVLSRIGENENHFRAALFLEEGLRRISALNYSGADSSLTKAIELNPKLAQAYASRAEARLFYADKKVLMEDVNRAIELEPENALHYAVRARIRAFNACSGQNRKGCEDVISDINKAKSLDSTNPSYCVMLGALYASINQYDLAAREYDRAVQLLPSTLLPIAAVNTYINRAEFRLDEARGDYLKKALEDLNRAVSIISSPSYMTDDVKKFARVLQHNPKTEEDAHRLIRDIFGVDMRTMGEAGKKEFMAQSANAQQVLNNAALVYWKRSQVLYEAGDVNAAEKDRAAICQFTGGRSLVYSSGITADADICTSKGTYEPFASRKNLQAYQFFKRGERFYAKNNYKETIVQVSRALELDSTMVEAYILRGFAYEFGTPSLFAEAIADFTKAIKLAPKKSRPLYERGIAYWARSKDRQWNGDEKGARHDRGMAEKDFSEVINLHNDMYTSQSYVQRARVFQTEGLYEKAAGDYDKAARLGGNIELFLDKAEMLKLAGETNEAVQAYDEYITAAKQSIAEQGEAGDRYLEEKIAEAESQKQKLKTPKEDR